MGLVSTTIPNLIGGISQQAYTIRMASQCEIMENCLPSVVEFLRRRPATRHIAKIMDGQVSQAGVHIIDRDSSEQYVVVAAGDTLKIFDLAGQEKTVTFSAGMNYLKSTHPNVEISFLTINDYTFVLNKTVKAAMLPDVPATRQPEALAFVKAANYATDYHIILDGMAFTHTTFKDDNRNTDGTEYKSTNGFDMNNTAGLDAGRYKLSSAVIAADLAAKINAAGPYACSVVKSTLWIRRHNAAAFTALAADSRSNTQLSITSDRVQRFSDLPVAAPQGYITEVTGDQSSSFDNYFVKFETHDASATFNDGVWTETVKPGIPDSLDAATMPHALIREADGTFTFKAMKWGKRCCGDLKSAPNPSFVGRKITSVFFYRNRLGLLANENCILSEAGSFFNFWPTTMTTIIDSDHIDVAASHTKAANLYHAAAFSEGLLLFSDQTQFLLKHGDVLSLKTVSVPPVTEFECSIKAQPIGAGKNIFFATKHGDFAGVREYFVEQDSNLTDATDITSHVPHYISGEIHKLIGSTNEDCLLCLSTEERQSLALYKYFWNGREKLQSSWSKWIFSGEVLSAAFLNSSLLLIMQYSDGVYLERLNIEPGYTDSGAPFEYSQDRKITEESILSITYDTALKQSTLTFPYALSARPSVVSRFMAPNEPQLHPPGVNHEVVSWSGNTAVVQGDLRGHKFLAGIPFTTRFRFSRQILREDSSSSGKLAVIEGRLQLRNFTLTHGDTGYFEVHVTPEYRNTDRRLFTGRMVGHGANILGQAVATSGTFRFPVLSRADAVTIDLISDSFLPFQITSAGWEGFYHIRSRRV